jgi:phage repressor protein C with HTH and peptisase S24 domain
MITAPPPRRSFLALLTGAAAAPAALGLPAAAASSARSRPLFLPEGYELREAHGDGMAPTLQPGQPVIVDTRDRVPSPPGIFEIRTAGGTELVRLQVIGGRPVRVRLIRDNERYFSCDVAPSALDIVGRVISRFDRL